MTPPVSSSRSLAVPPLNGLSPSLSSPLISRRPFGLTALSVNPTSSFPFDLISPLSRKPNWSNRKSSDNLSHLTKPDTLSLSPSFLPKENPDFLPPSVTITTEKETKEGRSSFSQFSPEPSAQSLSSSSASNKNNGDSHSCGAVTASRGLVVDTGVNADSNITSSSGNTLQTPSLTTHGYYNGLFSPCKLSRSASVPNVHETTTTSSISVSPLPLPVSATTAFFLPPAPLKLAYSYSAAPFVSSSSCSSIDILASISDSGDLSHAQAPAETYTGYMGSATSRSTSCSRPFSSSDSKSRGVIIKRSSSGASTSSDSNLNANAYSAASASVRARAFSGEKKITHRRGGSSTSSSGSLTDSCETPRGSDSSISLGPGRERSSSCGITSSNRNNSLNKNNTIGNSDASADSKSDSSVPAFHGDPKPPLLYMDSLDSLPATSDTSATSSPTPSPYIGYSERDSIVCMRSSSLAALNISSELYPNRVFFRVPYSPVAAGSLLSNDLGGEIDLNGPCLREFSNGRKKYRAIKIVGKGNFGVAYLVADPKEHLYVLKTLECQNDEKFNTALAEAKVLGDMPNNPHLLKQKDFFLEGPELCIVVTYCSGSNLDQQVHLNLPPNEIVRILQELSSGLQALHENDIIHRDLKPDNIFLSDPVRRTVVIGDMGMARHLSEDGYYDSTFGHTLYKAPEIQFGKFSSRSDMWAVGCIGLELLSGTTLTTFYRQTKKILGREKDQSIAEIVESLLGPHNSKHLAAHLVRRLLITDPRKRLTAAQVLRATIDGPVPSIDLDLADEQGSAPVGSEPLMPQEIDGVLAIAVVMRPLIATLASAIFKEGYVQGTKLTLKETTYAEELATQIGELDKGCRGISDSRVSASTEYLMRALRSVEADCHAPKGDDIPEIKARLRKACGKASKALTKTLSVGNRVTALEVFILSQLILNQQTSLRDIVLELNKLHTDPTIVNLFIHLRGGVRKESRRLVVGRRIAYLNHFLRLDLGLSVHESSRVDITVDKEVIDPLYWKVLITEPKAFLSNATATVAVPFTMAGVLMSQTSHALTSVFEKTKIKKKGRDAEAPRDVISMLTPLEPAVTPPPQGHSRGPSFLKRLRMFGKQSKSRGSTAEATTPDSVTMSSPDMFPGGNPDASRGFSLGSPTDLEESASTPSRWSRQSLHSPTKHSRSFPFILPSLSGPFPRKNAATTISTHTITPTDLSYRT